MEVVYRLAATSDRAETQERLAIRVSRQLKSIDVIDALSDLFILNRVPSAIRVDNGPEFVSKALDRWAYANGVTLAFSRPGKPNR